MRSKSYLSARSQRKRFTWLLSISELLTPGLPLGPMGELTFRRVRTLFATIPPTPLISQLKVLRSQEADFLGLVPPGTAPSTKAELSKLSQGTPVFFNWGARDAILN